jgi:hypothetical protein
MNSIASPRPTTLLDGIAERADSGVPVLYPSGQNPLRRILFLNSYGGSEVWVKVKAGLLPPHHMWGCLELVRMGYEVALIDPLKHFNFRRPLPHDWPVFRFAKRWLGPDDIIYCGHTLLFWVPLLRALDRLKCHVVSMTYAREELHFARLHQGILALTPAAADQARKMAPGARVAHVAWGCDLSFFPKLAFNPRWFLSCGITHRDFTTLSAAAAPSSCAIRLICPGRPREIPWSNNVTVIDGGPGWNHQKANIGYDELFHEHYSGSIASLIILKHDPTEYTAVGFTNLLEALALSRAVIVTRTGAIPGEIDVEKAGCGLHVPPNDPAALANAMRILVSDPARAATMGAIGRRLAESHYNIVRFARDVDDFFQKL